MFSSQLVALKLAIIPVYSLHVFVVVKDNRWFLDYSLSSCHILHGVIMKRADEYNIPFVFPLHDHLFLAECCYCFPLFLVLPSSQNLGTLFYWSSWFQQHLFFWYIRCQQDLDWCTSCPGKDSSPYQVGRGLPPTQSSKKSFGLGVSNHKWYPYQCIL